jgi:hypothetical protein
MSLSCNTEERIRERLLNMSTYYDDNFGFWEDMHEEENREFYKKVQQTNVRKKCKGCDKWVRIQPQYAYCNSCADKRERGIDI